MNPQLAAWSWAFVATSVAAVAMWFASSNAPAPPPGTEVVVQKDPARLTDAELEVILGDLRKGDLLAQQGDLDGARAAWRSCRERGKGYWPVHEGLAASYDRHGLVAEAREEYLTAEELCGEALPERVGALRQRRAELADKAGDLAEALALYVELADPGRHGPAIGALLTRSPELAKPLEEQAERRDARLWKVLAAWRAGRNEPDAAALALGRYARGVAPWDATLCRRAIEDLRRRKLWDEAVAVGRAWAKASPNEIAMYELLGDVLREAGRDSDAFLMYTSIVDVRAGDAYANHRLGVIFRKLGRPADALRQFEAARKLRPEEPYWLQEIAATKLGEGDFAAADAAFEELMKTKWDGRFGDIGAQVRPKFAEAFQKRIDDALAAKNPELAATLRAKALERKLPEVGAYDVKVIIRWDTQADVDLDVKEPSGVVVNHGSSKSPSGGLYYYDNTRGFGPEHYTLPKAPAGSYVVGAHLHGSERSTVQFEVILHEGTEREQRWKDSAILDGSTTQVWLKPFEVK